MTDKSFNVRVNSEGKRDLKKFFRHEGLLLKFFLFSLPLGKFFSDAFFALYGHEIICFFKSIFIYFDRLIVCIVIKHRYEFFADDFSAFDLAVGLISELSHHLNFITIMVFV